MLIEMSEEDLHARLRNFEDHFVERKTVGDSKDWLKTVVAFANSAPVGMPCILYIGVKDDGKFEPRQCDLDSVQKTLNKMLEAAYPRVAYFPKIITDGNGQALAVIVPGSELRPHFSGPSYVRSGSETKEASDAQFKALIAMRSSKAALLLEHLNKQVTVVNNQLLGNGTFTQSGWWNGARIMDCNQFWVTLQGSDLPQSFPLRDVELSFDNQMKRLKLEITTRQSF